MSCRAAVAFISSARALTQSKKLIRLLYIASSSIIPREGSYWNCATDMPLECFLKKGLDFTHWTGNDATVAS